MLPNLQTVLPKLCLFCIKFVTPGIRFPRVKKKMLKIKDYRIKQPRVPVSSATFWAELPSNLLGDLRCYFTALCVICIIWKIEK